MHTHTLETRSTQTNGGLRKCREAWAARTPRSPTSGSAPRSGGDGGRSGASLAVQAAARGVRAGPARAQKLPQSDFPTVEPQPSPCPCLKNFLNSIPVLFLAALKPYSVSASIRLCQANPELLGCLQLSMGNTCESVAGPPQQSPWRLLGSQSPQRSCFYNQFGRLSPSPHRLCSAGLDAGDRKSPLSPAPHGPPGAATFTGSWLTPASPLIPTVLTTSLWQLRVVNPRVISLPAWPQSSLTISAAGGGTLG